MYVTFRAIAPTPGDNRHFRLGLVSSRLRLRQRDIPGLGLQPCMHSTHADLIYGTRTVKWAQR